MRLRFHIAALAAALLFASCSDDPVRTPGATGSKYQTATVEMYASDIRAVWGRSTDDLYASGDAFLHFDGLSWNPIELPVRGGSFEAIWGEPSGTINVIGLGGLHRYDRNQWTQVDVPVFLRHWCAMPDGQLFVVDFSRAVVRYDGTSWTALDSLPPIEGNIYSEDSYYDFTGDAPDNLFAVGAMGTIAHFDGSSWSSASYLDQRGIDSAWKMPGGPLYVDTWGDSLYAFDGTTLSPIEFGIPFRPYEIVGEASSLYVRGYDESRGCYGVMMLDGANWRSIICDEVNSTHCAWRAPTGESFLGTRGGLWRVDDEERTTPLGDGYNRGDEFFDMWGSEQDGIFAVGYRALRHFNGEWTDLNKEDLTMDPAYSITGTSARDLWAAGPRLILHYDGTTWTWVSGANQETMLGIWAGKREVLAVGGDGTIMRSDRETWELMPTPTTNTLNTIWGWEGGAFAAGWSGTILRYDGTSWELEESPVNWTILDLFGFNAHDVYAVGVNPFEICHFNGDEWVPQDTGLYTGTDNQAIWGTSENNLFVLNTFGGITHYDGRSWTPLPRYAGGLRSIWGTENGDLFVAGGGILRYHR